MIARLILSGVFFFFFFFLLLCPAQPALPWPARCDSFHLNFGIPSWARLYNGVFGVLFHRNPEDIQNGTRPEWAQAWSVSAWESDLRCHILDSHASKILVSRQRKAMLFFFFFFSSGLLLHFLVPVCHLTHLHFGFAQWEPNSLVIFRQSPAGRTLLDILILLLLSQISLFSFLYLYRICHSLVLGAEGYIRAWIHWTVSPRTLFLIFLVFGSLPCCKGIKEVILLHRSGIMSQMEQRFLQPQVTNEQNKKQRVRGSLLRCGRWTVACRACISTQGSGSVPF